MGSNLLTDLQRSVDILTERSINTARINEHIQKQNEALALKLDVILSQIAQNSIENVEAHMALKVSVKNKIDSAVTVLKNIHDEDIRDLNGNIMIKLGNSRKLLTVIGLIILFTFWQNIDGVLRKIASGHGIELHEKSPAIVKDSETWGIQQEAKDVE